MIIADLSQGSPEWHVYRSLFYNASDASAMMGVSKYKSRNKLIDELTQGKAEPNSYVAKLFARGHVTEALARPVAEAIIGQSLTPYVINDGGMLSASLDGATKDFSIIWEHKMLNKEIRLYKSTKDISLHYIYQMEQQAMISGCDMCLFMATERDGDELGDCITLSYTPNKVLQGKLVDGWNKLHKDITSMGLKRI